MDTNESKIEDQVLPEDVDEGIKLIAFRDYSLAQINYCIETQDNTGAWRWSLEQKRTVNDLKYLQFKKIDSERKMKNEKGN